MSIKGLHGLYDVEIEFSSSISIFMGPNGIGKSTVLNIFVHLVTAQWERLAKQYFESVDIYFKNGVHVHITKDELVDTGSFSIPPARMQNYISALDKAGKLDPFLAGARLTAEDEREISEAIKTPRSDLRYLRATLQASTNHSYILLLQKERVIRQNFPLQIIYLPTYRRIEQDIKEIFSLSPGAMRNIRTEITDAVSSTEKSYVELVRFGMDDIDQLIESYAASIKEYSRQQVNSLSTRYLTAALKQGQKFDRNFFKNLGDESIKDVLSRVDDQELIASERARLTDLIKSIRVPKKGGRLTRPQEHIAPYFQMLYETHARISAREAPLRGLAELLNRYIGPEKYASYDPTKYEFRVRSRSGSAIPLAGLSSGEKQIISLFSLLSLSLSQPDHSYVVIDEPELSLSVLWQETLISDIVSTTMCAGILAVTHSPFIYGEKMARYTKDLSDFVKVRAI